MSQPPVHIACFEDWTLGPRALRLTSKLLNFPTISYPYQECNFVQTPKVFVPLLPSSAEDVRRRKEPSSQSLTSV